MACDVSPVAMFSLRIVPQVFALVLFCSIFAVYHFVFTVFSLSTNSCTILALLPCCPRNLFTPDKQEDAGDSLPSSPFKLNTATLPLCQIQIQVQIQKENVNTNADTQEEARFFFSFPFQYCRSATLPYTNIRTITNTNTNTDTITNINTNTDKQKDAGDFFPFKLNTATRVYRNFKMLSEFHSHLIYFGSVYIYETHVAIKKLSLLSLFRYPKCHFDT